VKVGLGQFNPKIGDCAGNTGKIVAFIEQAKSQKAELIVLPELAVCGYPPRDLLDDPTLVEANLRGLEEIAAASKGTTVFCGFVQFNDAPTGRRYFNAVAILQDGRHVETYRKRLLPSYDIFDDDRYFEPGDKSCVVTVNKEKVAVTICEDVWNIASHVSRLYEMQPLDEVKNQNVDLLVNIAASPFALGKPDRRLKLFRAITAHIGVPVLFCNQVGGDDELIFSGGSFAMNAKGEVIGCAKAFVEELLYIDTDKANGKCAIPWPASEGEWIREALVLGLRDYVRKCGAKNVLVGLSGGVDSSVTAAVAVSALGKEAVMGVCIPTRYTSKASLEDAETLAKNLDIEYRVLGIETLLGLYENLWREWFHRAPKSLTRQNIQPRIRMNLLMALCNERNKLLLNTSNKSELTAGYTTLYGDTSGAVAVLGDVLKTQVYEVAKVINQREMVIPERVLSRVPTAELAENQSDQDVLPPYDQLDPLIKEFIENKKSRNELLEEGFDIELVDKVEKLHYSTEFKRYQLAPVLRVSSRAFGIGRRIPIASNRSFD